MIVVTVDLFELIGLGITLILVAILVICWLCEKISDKLETRKQRKIKN